MQLCAGWDEGALYQVHVAAAVIDTKAGNDHSVELYTFVFDYGQNMDLVVYNEGQPGCT